LVVFFSFQKPRIALSQYISIVALEGLRFIVVSKKRGWHTLRRRAYLAPKKARRVVEDEDEGAVTLWEASRVESVV
jgi:hypothetical protein